MHVCRPRLTQDSDMQKYLTLKEVRSRLGNRSRSSIYGDIAADRKD